MAKVNKLLIKIKEDILNGIYGKSGYKFLTLREFCQKTKISYVTAVKIYEELKKENLIFLYGNYHYIFNGIYDENSHLYKIINANTKIKIGLHIRDISNQFFMALSKEICNQLNVFNIDLIIMTSNNNSLQEKKILLDFIKLGCSGVLSFPGFKDNQIYDFYSRYPLPYILIGRSFNQNKSDFISTDNYESGILAAKYLVNCNYKNFGYVGLKNIDENNDSRLLGYKKGLADSNCILSPNLYFKIDIEDSIDYIYRILIKTDYPIGLFCYHDLLAVKILNLCSYNKINVPNSVGIIGYDNLPISIAVNPSITTFSYDYNMFAKLIVNKLLYNIKNLKAENQVHIINTFMIIRKSTCNLNNV